MVRLDSGWIEIISEEKTKFIPYHRIRRITYDGTVMWEKREKSEKKKDE